MKYKCYGCDWVYEEEKGDKKTKLSPGTKYEDILKDWVCIRCKEQEKFTDFMLVENPLWLFSSSQVRKELFVGSKVKERAIQKYMPKRTWEKMKSLVDRQGD